MAVIMNFAIFPIDKTDHIGEYVSEVVAYIRSTGLSYQFSPMGTIVEASTVRELLDVVDEAYNIMDPVSDRIYCVINMDSNKKKSNLIDQKRKSIERRIGDID